MNFSGELSVLQFGLNEVRNYFNLGLEDEVKVVQLEASSDVCLRVTRGVENVIAYKAKHHFFRGLSLYMQFVEEGQATFNYEEKAWIPVSGAMFDVSRNSVYKVDKVKQLLVHLALMGHSTCMLYTEDTYTIAEYPYFGYMRGRYTQEELKELDEYAYQLGIELIPCIQTLAHLKQTLKWNYAMQFKDTADVLLVGVPETYVFLDNMLKSIRETFRTRRIHIGMDEACDLGLGRSLEVHGHKHHLELMSMHLKELCKLLDKYNFEPMAWDDMFMRAATPNGDPYDLGVALDASLTASIPENMSLVYWDYYHDEESFYDASINLKKKLKRPIIFAGGIWKWTGYAPNYGRTFLTTNSALTICKQHGIQEVLATMWGDDGDEAPIDVALLGLIYFGEHSYLESVDDAWLDRRCKYLTGLSLDDMKSPEALNLIEGVDQPNVKSCNPSKQFLYQDILLGAFDFYAEDLDLTTYYSDLADQYSAIAAKSCAYSSMFNMYAALSTVLATKATIGVELRQAYLEQDHETLAVLAEEVLPMLISDMEDFIAALRTIWYTDCKGHGFEILDIRLNGVIGRAKTAIYRVNSYLNGETDQIEELADDRLPFHTGWNNQDNIICFDQYTSIASQGATF
ncbi:MAG: beta-N-acetylhexosaminidase [Niameybacter sp.]